MIGGPGGPVHGGADRRLGEGLPRPVRELPLRLHLEGRSGGQRRYLALVEQVMPIAEQLWDWVHVAVQGPRANRRNSTGCSCSQVQPPTGQDMGDFFAPTTSPTWTRSHASTTRVTWACPLLRPVPAVLRARQGKAATRTMATSRALPSTNGSPSERTARWSAARTFRRLWSPARAPGASTPRFRTSPPTRGIAESRARSRRRASGGAASAGGHCDSFPPTSA